MIAIIDYGLGNLNSVITMVRKAGYEAIITSSLEQIAVADKIILPGVGSFDQGIKNLLKLDLITTLNRKVLIDKVPILGICLGMQLMTYRSDEGCHNGLGWLNAITVKFKFDIPKTTMRKIPHMGWNTVSIMQNNPILSGERQRFYFVHSYHVVCEDKEDVLATCNYGHDFVAAFGHGNIFGVQFHPEKSHRFGMALMRRFLEVRNC